MSSVTGRSNSRVVSYDKLRIGDFVWHRAQESAPREAIIVAILEPDNGVVVVFPTREEDHGSVQLPVLSEASIPVSTCLHGEFGRLDAEEVLRTAPKSTWPKHRSAFFDASVNRLRPVFDMDTLVRMIPEKLTSEHEAYTIGTVSEAGEAKSEQAAIGGVVGDELRSLFRDLQRDTATQIAAFANDVDRKIAEVAAIARAGPASEERGGKTSGVAAEPTLGDLMSRLSASSGRSASTRRTTRVVALSRRSSGRASARARSVTRAASTRNRTRRTTARCSAPGARDASATGG